ncbi:MAG: FAD-binding oxidoreductase [Eubacterium sp.]|nr:FAD-binding oxidoreductase [Eubacterium sp.]
MSNLDTYVKALSQADSALEIVTDKDACAAYVNKNYSRIPADLPDAILYPTSSAQIEQIVKLANEHEISLAVRSSQGEETYHGSSVPVKGKRCVAVNLSKMTKIMHIDTKNGVALIEPGVTYTQLTEALKPHGCYIEHPLMPRAEKSVIASLLDREPVMSPKHCWDIPDPLACVELVMGNGCVFRTGSAAGPGTLEEMLKSGCAINQPQGPYCLDLARVISGSQGTLAIVTWASVKIRPIGSASALCYAQSEDVDALTAFTSQVIRRRLGENTFLVNKKALAQITGMEDAVTEKMPEWTFVSDVRGNRYFPERYKDNQIADMKEIAEQYGVTVTERLDGIGNDVIDGVINQISKPGGYWRDRYGTGKMEQFFLSTLDKVDFYTKIAKAVVKKCGLASEELAVYIQPCMMGRNCHIEFLIPTCNGARAASAAGETETASDIGSYDTEQLEKMLGTALLDNHAFFSRPYGALTESIYKKSSTQTPFMAHIKKFFDEKNILNPGKLVYDGGRN